VRKIVKQRCLQAGLQGDFSAHSLRSGFLSEAADAMAMTGHRNYETFRSGSGMSRGGCWIRKSLGRAHRAHGRWRMHRAGARAWPRGSEVIGRWRFRMRFGITRVACRRKWLRRSASIRRLMGYEPAARIAELLTYTTKKGRWLPEKP
jgi:hypothetical protein